jgi:hypothetical protein
MLRAEASVMNARPNAATNLQGELSETYEQASRSWLSRANSETALWSELATKLSTTRSIPEVPRGLSKVRGSAHANGCQGRTATI